MLDRFFLDLPHALAADAEYLSDFVQRTTLVQYLYSVSIPAIMNSARAVKCLLQLFG